MKPEDRSPTPPAASEPGISIDAPPALPAAVHPPTPSEFTETSFLNRTLEFLQWVLVGDKGLRAGWSVTIFLMFTLSFLFILEAGAKIFLSSFLHIHTGNLSPVSGLISELVEFLSILGAVAVCALIERRRILDYNLNGPTRLRHFAVGSVAGFGALSLLVCSLYAGGWIHFKSSDLHGAQIVQYGVIWGVVFLLTGLAEEGSVRCYLQFTLTRGINFWWAIVIIATMCASGGIHVHNEWMWGVYAMAALGVLPCLMLHLNRAESAGFWQAAWVSSTFFGFIHTGNDGENWIGIFAAAAIGFVLCVSIRLTGSAWWAIGFHASWDWGQTFFYGTPDSGFVADGHFLTTTPAGATLWSGGTDGPEGSLLILPMILIILSVILLVYRRSKTVETTSPAVQPQLS
jgi:uncharacterized protein